MKNSLRKKGESILRVLDVLESEVLIIDCIKLTMPRWIEADALKGYILCEETVLSNVFKKQGRTTLLNHQGDILGTQWVV